MPANDNDAANILKTSEFGGDIRSFFGIDNEEVEVGKFARATTILTLLLILYQCYAEGGSNDSKKRQSEEHKLSHGVMQDLFNQLI